MSSPIARYVPPLVGLVVDSLALMFLMVTLGLTPLAHADPGQICTPAE
jgi:hypothetical protein